MSEAPERHAERSRSTLAKLGLAIASLAVTLAFLELVLSALFEPVLRVWPVHELFQLDDELIYSLKPSHERVAESDEFIEHARTNRNGLRDTEIGPRADFDKRIVVLGDSMVFGHGVDDAETFPNQLEAIYRSRSRAVDVINAGVKGYGTDGAYKFFLDRLRPLDLEPDLVIFSIYQNDLRDNIGQPLYTIENGALAPLDPTRNWMYLLGSIDRRMPAFVRNRVLYGLVLSRFVGRDVYSVLPDLDEEGLIDWAARKALFQIVALQRLGRREGFRVMVLCLPYRDGPTDFCSWLHPVAQLDVWFLDPNRAPIWRTDAERLFFSVDYHYSPAGNRLLAENLSEALDGEGF